MSKFLSRKFLLTLGVILGTVGAALQGDITAVQAGYSVLAALLAYLGVEGTADIVKISKGE